MRSPNPYQRQYKDSLSFLTEIAKSFILIIYFPCISEHAIIAVDNTISHENYLEAFYEKVTESKKFIVEILPISGSLCVLRRR